MEGTATNGPFPSAAILRPEYPVAGPQNYIGLPGHECLCMCSTINTVSSPEQSKNIPETEVGTADRGCGYHEMQNMITSSSRCQQSMHCTRRNQHSEPSMQRHGLAHFNVLKRLLLNNAAA